MAAQIVLHSFELHPEWPTGTTEPLLQVATRAHGVGPEQARLREEAMARQAAAEGLPFVVDRPVGNTFAVHRVLQLANEREVGTAFFTDLQAEYFAGRSNPVDPEQVVAAAARHGIPEGDTRRVLAGHAYADDVHADEAQARELGVTGVPFAVLGGRLAVAGAQSVEVYADVLARAAAGVSA
ncbi:putative DsbA family dithiol-disulfide isomerase [Friedmanniella endophytica]|uniref:Putative DsbA family dithiol-disulfide isomerase n=1 Tax=Microlunatus kandeliicorticis TaxID=1759536 RepID=A0A7W3P662_9ACTN|nr:putative DsbA family dithiol-disulfide isomerase [Microlunatus kandeliicorticis]